MIDGMSMTLSKYCDNPYGKGATFANASAIKENLIDRYRVLRENENFKHKTYILNSDSEFKVYYVLVDVPSESVNMEYQVLIELTPTVDTVDKKIIDDYEVRFYSNSPSFIFTHAYVFNMYELFISELSYKYDELILTREPVIKNYYKILGFEKSLFFSSTYLLAHNDKRDLERNSENIESIDEISPLLLSQNEILKKIDAKKKIQRQKIKTDPRYALTHKIKQDVKKHSKKQATTNPNDIMHGANKNIKLHKIEPKSKVGSRNKIKSKGKIRGRK